MAGVVARPWWGSSGAALSPIPRWAATGGFAKLRQRRGPPWRTTCRVVLRCAWTMQPRRRSAKKGAHRSIPARPKGDAMWIAQAGYVPVLAHVLPPRAGPRRRPRADPDALFAGQGGELDAKRAAALDKLQERVSERAIWAHMRQLAFLNGAGPRVGASGQGLIAGYAHS